MALAQRKAEILSSMAYEYFILWTMLGWEFMSVFMFLRRWMANLYIIFKNGKKKINDKSNIFFYIQDTFMLRGIVPQSKPEKIFELNKRLQRYLYLSKNNIYLL